MERTLGIEDLGKRIMIRFGGTSTLEGVVTEKFSSQNKGWEFLKSLTVICLRGKNIVEVHKESAFYIADEERGKLTLSRFKISNYIYPDQPYQRECYEYYSRALKNAGITSAA